MRRRHPAQSGVTPMIIVKRLVGLELPLEIALVPKPDSVEILAPDSFNQALNKCMRTRRARDGLDLVDLENPKVRAPAMKAEQRIVV